MMRSDMPKQIQVFRNGGGIASLATVPMETTMGGQPHRLAYVNPVEEEMMKEMGGLGVPGPGGIPSYLFGFSSISDMFDGGGKGGSGASFSTKSHEDYVKDNPDDKTAKAHPTSNDDNKSSSSSTDVGIVDSILMGLGLRDKTANYYAATADTIARTQGIDAANNYINNISSNENITTGFDSTGNIQSTGVAEALAGLDLTGAASQFEATGGGGGGDDSGAVATTTDVVTGGDDGVVTQNTINNFVMNEDQQTAALGTLKRINEDLFKITQGRSFEELSSGEKQAFIKNNAPTAAELSSILGVEQAVASNILNAPGAGTDLRNWSQILQDDNPLAATQAATAAMYSVENLAELQGVTMQPQESLLNPNQVISQSGNYVLYNPGTGGTATSKQLGMPGSLRLGIVNPLDDGRQMLLTSYGLGTVDDKFGDIAAQYGGGQGILDLLPALDTYYAENITIPETTYTQVVKDVNEFGDVSYYDRSGRRYAGGGLADRIVTQDGKTYLMSPQYDAADPFGDIGQITAASQGNMFLNAPDLDLGQQFLYTDDVGQFGFGGMNFQMTNKELLDQEAAKAAANELAQAQAAGISSGQPIINTQSFSSGQPNFSPLVPAAGTSTAGIVGLPSAGQPVAPATFTAYTPETYLPAVTPLTLPPLG